MDKGQVVVRQVRSEDLPFIYSTWLKGLYYGNSWFQEIKKDVFFEYYHQVLENLLEKSTTGVICLSEDQDVVLGYAVISTSQRTLHWIFVKKAWRKSGLARELLSGLNINTVTHLTKLGKALKKPEWEFNPFLI